MRKSIFITQIFIVILSTSAFVIHELGEQGKLPHPFLHEKIYPSLRRVASLFTDLKFQVRGPRKPKHPIVIVEIDSASIETLGRWPWRRDYIAYLVQKIYQSGAKTVGLDIIFSERQEIIPEELIPVLKKNGLSNWIHTLDVDKLFQQVLSIKSKSTVLAWASESPCRPKFTPSEFCPVTLPQVIASLPPSIEKFSIENIGNELQAQETAVFSAPTMLSNLAQLNQSVQYSGFANGFRDADGILRQSSLIMVANGKPYPSFALALAQASREKKLQLSWNKNYLTSLKIGEQSIPTSASGMTQINYLGPARTFPYVSAIDILEDAVTPPQETTRGLASLSPTPLKDAIVLVGISALAVSDIVATPFDSTVPGVEVHANLLDNILSDTLLQSSASSGLWYYLLLLMFLGGGGFILFTYKSEKVTFLALLFGSVITIVLLDIFSFKKNLNWNTGFYYLEMLALFSTTLATLYVEARKKKNLLKTAFSKYVAPAVVNSILKDPKQMSLGGRKEELTILFSDIRGFTSFSEKMDAQTLTKFLNEYLALMTDVIFEFHGTLDKYIGDAIMAFWGAPLRQPDHALRASHAATKMIQVLGTHRPRLYEKYGIHLEIGIGLNTGTVAVGNMGSEKSFNYTVIGDDVNLASRLESATKQFGVSILTTRTTLEAASTSEHSQPLPHRILAPTRVKGKENAVELIELLEQPLPGLAAEWYETGRKAYHKKDWEAAIQSFQKAADLFKQNGREDKLTQLFLEKSTLLSKSTTNNQIDLNWKLDSK